MMFAVSRQCCLPVAVSDRDARRTLDLSEARYEQECQLPVAVCRTADATK